LWNYLDFVFVFIYYYYYYYYYFYLMVKQSLLQQTLILSKNLLFICSFLLMRKGLALPALQICLEAFTWTDGEAVTKVSSFCAAVVVLSVTTNNVELREFVSRDLFSAIIQALALESNAITSADLVALCREIFVFLCDRDPAPRQVRCDTYILF
jgi:hypothetical protein